MCAIFFLQLQILDVVNFSKYLKNHFLKKCVRKLFDQVFFLRKNFKVSSKDKV
jgi:hypothetical protein